MYNIALLYWPIKGDATVLTRSIAQCACSTHINFIIEPLRNSNAWDFSLTMLQLSSMDQLSDKIKLILHFMVKETWKCGQAPLFAGSSLY